MPVEHWETESCATEAENERMPNNVRKSHKQAEADVFIVAGKLYMYF